MKAKLLKLFVLTLCISLALFVASCGSKTGESKNPSKESEAESLLESEESTPNHEHRREFLKYVDAYHWYECSCGITYGLEEHEYKLKYNENSHWYECSCGAKDGEEDHEGGTATCTEKAVCKACGQAYGILAHEYKELKYNENSHWYECVCGDIGAKVNHEYELKYNENSHWYECSCGITYGLEEHNFKDNICTICREDNFSKGLKYKLNSDGKSYSVVGIGSCTDTEIIIPSLYNELPVTSIGYRAFEDCSRLTSVVIGDSVTSIGWYAFAQCDSLTSVVIGDSVTSICNLAFLGCSSLTSVEIGDSVTSIGENAFRYCYTLVEVINKSSHITVEKGSSSNGYLGYYALSVSNCDDTYVSKLTNDSGYIVYTEGEEKILVGYSGKEANLVLPEYITKIYQRAFRGCDSLTSVEIPNSVTSIGDFAFYKCFSLTSVEIGDSVTSIGSYAFSGCTSLTSVTFKDTSTWYVTTRSSYTGGTQIDVTNPSQNATYLTSTYEDYYWYKE